MMTTRLEPSSRTMVRATSVLPDPDPPAMPMRMRRDMPSRRYQRRGVGYNAIAPRFARRRNATSGAERSARRGDSHVSRRAQRGARKERSPHGNKARRRSAQGRAGEAPRLGDTRREVSPDFQV